MTAMGLNMSGYVIHCCRDSGLVDADMETDLRRLSPEPGAAETVQEQRIRSDPCSGALQGSFSGHRNRKRREVTLAATESLLGLGKMGDLKRRLLFLLGALLVARLVFRLQRNGLAINAAQNVACMRHGKAG